MTNPIPHAPAGANTTHHVVGCTHDYKVIPEQSSGAFTIFEITVPPRCGPPLHVHEQDAEWMYVLEGTLTFENPQGRIVAGPGDSCLLPAGIAHGFYNPTERPARAIVVASPGAQAFRFFQEIDQRLHGAVEVPVVVDVAAKHGITMCPPSMAA